MTDPPRVLAVADSDSYIKWAAATLGRLPAGWRKTLAVLESPISPSERQVHDAIPGGCPAPSRVRFRSFGGFVRGERPDVLVVACTGPVAHEVTRSALRSGGRRPAIAAGLPGIAVPVTDMAVRYRSGADLLIAHSARERTELGQVSHRLGLSQVVSLSRLPFLDDGPHPPGPEPGDLVVFAAQAKVPEARSQREVVLRALADLAEADPGLRVVVKLRARPGEGQTHTERWPYPELWDSLVTRGLVADGAVRFEYGSMREHLDRAHGLVTVSSTAALEAMARGVAVLVLSDFGLDSDQLNVVYLDSGCVGSLEDLRAGRFMQPQPAWMARNYFHPEDDNDLSERIAELAFAARAGRLPATSGAQLVRRRTRLRAQLRLRLPRPLALALRRGA